MTELFPDNRSLPPEKQVKMIDAISKKPQCSDHPDDTSKSFGLFSRKRLKTPSASIMSKSERLF